METKTIALGSNPEVVLERVGGDLEIRGWDRPELELKGDDIHALEQDGNSVSLSCGGDLQLSVPRSAVLSLSFVGGDLDLGEVDGKVAIEFVGGSASLHNLKGEVSVEGVVGDLQMDGVSRVSVSAGGHGPDLSKNISRRIEQATRQAQRQAEQTRRRVERELRGKLHEKTRGWKMNLNFDPRNFAAGPRPEPVSDEERMAILKMLQDKKITSEEADKLLAALEGAM